MNNIYCLIKFGNKNNIESLLKGKLYINTLNFYREFEGNNAIKDEDEGLALQYQSQNTNLKIGEHIINSEDITRPVEVRICSDQCLNVFCMYALTDDLIQKSNFSFEIDQENFQFGEYCLLISDVKVFLERILNSLEKLNSLNTDELKVKYLGSKLVEYIEKKNYHGKVGAFKKDISYSYQSEFRFVFQVPEILKGEKKQFVLDIGDITDIAKSYKSSEISEKIVINID